MANLYYEPVSMASRSDRPRGHAQLWAAYLLSLRERHRLGGAPRRGGVVPLWWSSRMETGGRAKPLPYGSERGLQALGGVTPPARTDCRALCCRGGDCTSYSSKEEEGEAENERRGKVMSERWVGSRVMKKQEEMG